MAQHVDEDELSTDHRTMTQMKFSPTPILDKQIEQATRIPAERTANL
jgi:hypothetical protein